MIALVSSVLGREAARHADTRLPRHADDDTMRRLYDEAWPQIGEGRPEGVQDADSCADWTMSDWLAMHAWTWGLKKARHMPVAADTTTSCTLDLDGLRAALPGVEHMRTPTTGAPLTCLAYMEGRRVREGGGSMLGIGLVGPTSSTLDRLREAWTAGFIDATNDALRGTTSIPRSIVAVLSCIPME